MSIPILRGLAGAGGSFSHPSLPSRVGVAQQSSLVPRIIVRGVRGGETAKFRLLREGLPEDGLKPGLGGLVLVR